MKKIRLEILNFHEIFRDRMIKIGDIVENLRSGGGLDLIVNITEQDPKWGYVIFGHSKEKNGTIIERKYWEREHIHNEIMKNFPEIQKKQ